MYTGAVYGLTHEIAHSWKICLFLLEIILAKILPLNIQRINLIYFCYVNWIVFAILHLINFKCKIIKTAFGKCKSNTIWTYF